MTLARTCFAVSALLLLSACAPHLVAIGEPEPGFDAGYGMLEVDIHEVVNQERSSQMLPPLAFDPELAEIAREHSSAMASGDRPFGHDAFRERARVVRGTLPGTRAVAENVASEPGTHRPDPSLIVSRWLQSSGHRRTIHDGAHTRTGIGVSRAPSGELFVTQIFVDARDAAAGGL